MADKVYDAIVVGSGATGGWAAKELCEAGMEVCMLEMGTKLDPEKDFSEHTLPHQLPLRGRPDPRNEKLQRRPVQRRTYACHETNADFFIDDMDNPYTTEKGKPFWWIRGGRVGGRTIMWGRQSYRFSDYDFKAASHDGYGDDWPISYSDIEPYYTKVERFIGVSGRREGFKILPDGYFQPPMAYRCGEVILKDAIEKMGRQFTIGRVAVNTRKHQGRAECHYCGPCEKGCSTGSYFSSPVSTLPAAEATGKFTLVTNAIARQVTTNDAGLAKGVAYIDKDTNQEREVEAKIVLLCASTLESARLLFNSANDQHPNGLANSSDVLGHYLMDHYFAMGAGGIMPTRRGAKAERAKRPNGVYIPRFRNVDTKEKNFIRGFGYQGGENVTVYEHAYSVKGYGADFKHDVRDTSISRIYLTGFCEMLPYKHNRAYLDPEVTDAWGIPAIKVDCKRGDNEEALGVDAAEQAKAMLEAAGAEDVRSNSSTAPPGFAIHEVGTARMGNDPKTSVLNKWNQTHDVKNLFVTDGSCFTSMSCVNPTLTMMALTARACDYIVEEHKRGNLA